MSRARGAGLRVAGSSGGRGSRLTSIFAVIAVVLSMATTTVALPGAAAAAAAIPFDTFFSTQDNGAIALLGNSQMTCPASTACTNAQTAVATANAQSNVDNNGFAMTFVGADSDPPTSNSTSADLSLPGGSTLLSALLVWGGRRADSITLARAAQVKFKAPGA